MQDLVICDSEYIMSDKILQVYFDVIEDTLNRTHISLSMILYDALVMGSSKAQLIEIHNKMSNFTYHFNTIKEYYRPLTRDFILRLDQIDYNIY